MIKVEEEIKVDRAELLRLFDGVAEEYLKSELSILAHKDIRNVMVVDLVPILNGNRELLTFLLESYELQGFLAISRYTEDVLSSRVYITDEFIKRALIIDEYSETLTLNALRKGTNRVYRGILLLNRHNNGMPFNLIDLLNFDYGSTVMKDCMLLAKHGYISFIFNGYLDLPGVCLTDKEF